MKYNVLIVDDEALARKLLSTYVEKDERLALVGMCATASEAFAAIRNNQVDILLLDIHLPDTNGLDLARTCKDIPVIIFTTAYSEHALESYSLDATDYLLKPISPDRFKTARLPNPVEFIPSIPSLVQTGARHLLQLCPD